MKETKDRSLLYLNCIFYVRIISLLLSLILFNVTIKNSVLSASMSYFKQLPNVLVALCLIKLSGRYRASGICNLVLVLLSIWTSLFHDFLLPYFYTVLSRRVVLFLLYFPSNITTFVALAALFLEYAAHAAFFPADKKKWYILLICSAAISIASYLIAHLIPLATLQSLSPIFISKWNIGARALITAFDLSYCILLWRGIRMIEKSKPEENDIC